MSGQIVPEKDHYNYCLVLADYMVQRCQEPPWFRKRYYADGELEQLTKYGLSVNTLAAQALALHLCHEEPQGLNPSKIRRRLGAERKRLQKAHCGLESLRN
jgi:hypothetical protein